MSKKNGDAWHKLTISGGIFHCERGGSDCLTHATEPAEQMAFVEPQMTKEIQDEAHDQSLTELTQKVNQLLSDAVQKRTDRNLRLTKTLRGIVVMWTHKDAPTAADTPKLTDNEILEALGLKPVSTDEKSGHYIFSPHGGHFHCVEPGASCIAPETEPAVGNFFLHPQLKKEMQDDVHDKVLYESTDKLNSLVYETVQKRNDRNLRMVITSKGLAWMWTEKADHKGEYENKELNDYEILSLLGLR